MLKLLLLKSTSILLLVTFIIQQITIINAHQNDVYEMNSLINDSISLPCNVSKYPLQHQPQAILWFRNELATGPPIFTLDLRSVNNQNIFSPNFQNSNDTFNKKVNQLDIEEPFTNINNRLSWDETSYLNFSKIDILKQAKSFVSDAYRDRIKFNVTSDPPSLIINNILEEDQGVYLCRIDYKWARTKSFTVNLNVIVPPKAFYIKDKSNNPVYAIAGPYNEDESLELICIAENGKPPPRLLWYLNQTVIDETFTIKETIRLESFNGSDVALKKPSSIKNQTLPLHWVENSLHILRLSRLYYNSILTCQVLRDHNSFIPKSISLRIDMYLKPIEVKIKSSKVSLVAGIMTEIECETFGSKPPADITWILNDKQINCNRNCTQTISSNEDEPSTTKSVLRFTPTKNHRNAKLVCKAKNVLLDHHYIQDQWVLSILYKPVLNLVLLGENDFAIEHHTIALQCNVQSNPPSINQIQWYYNGQLISIENKEMNQLNNSLLIGNVSKIKHEGSYSCEVENALGIGKSNVFQLYIHNVPKCKFLPKIITVEPNQSLNLTCEYQLSNFNNSINSNYQMLKNLSFYWKKKIDNLDSEGHLITSYQTLLPNKTNYESLKLNKKNYTKKEFEDQSILTLHLTKSSDYGLIFCEASNFVGKTEHPCKFLIKPPSKRPEVPKFCQISSFNNFTKKFIDKSFNNSNDIDFSFDFKQQNNYDIHYHKPNEDSSILLNENIKKEISFINDKNLFKNNFLIIDCKKSSTNNLENSFLEQKNLFIDKSKTYFYLELWCENKDESFLILSKKSFQKPKFFLNFDFFQNSSEDFLFSLLIFAENNQEKSNQVLKISFKKINQLLSKNTKDLFELIPYDVAVKNKLKSINFKKWESFRHTNLFNTNIFLFNATLTEKKQNEQQLNGINNFDNLNTHLKNSFFESKKQRKNSKSILKNDKHQSREDFLDEENFDQQTVAEENLLKHLSPSSHHINENFIKKNDNFTLKINTNTFNLAFISRLMVFLGVGLIFLTLLVSLFCYFRIKIKHLQLLACTENNSRNSEKVLLEDLETKQSLTQYPLNSISATLLHPNLSNGTINSIFTENVSNDNSFIIASTGTLLTPHSIDPSTATNLTIYSNQPSSVNYTDSYHNKLKLLSDKDVLNGEQYYHFNSPKCDPKLITSDLIELSCDSLQIVMEHKQKIYSELLSIDKPTHLHVEIQDSNQDLTLIPNSNINEALSTDLEDQEFVNQHVFCVSTQV